MANKYKPISNEMAAFIVNNFYNKKESKSTSQSEPSAVLIAGQPGAGKSQAAAMVKKELVERGGYFHIDADRMREKLPIGNTKPTSQETQGDAGRLAGALRNMAITNRRNIIEEGTFRDADMAERLIANIKEQGYKVNMVIVATPPEQSLVSIYSRYEEQMQIKTLNPRLVPEDYHDKVVLSFEKTLAKNAASIDEIRVINRDGVVLFDSTKHKDTNALEALSDGRKLTADTLNQIAEKWQKNIDMATSRSAKPEYLSVLQSHHARIEQFIKQEQGMALHKHAMQRLDAHAAVLNADPRYKNHTNDELAKAAYFRGYHEKDKELKGQTPNFQQYDAVIANREMLDELKDVSELKHHDIKNEQTRSNDGYSL